jgi:hypothetical protein
MSSVEEKLEKLGFKLPEISAPVAAYIPAKRAGNLIFTAGQLPMVNGELFATGLIKEDKTLPNNSKPIDTPYGVYYPDFSFNNRLIEIKCDYTYDILIGKNFEQEII